MWRAEVKRGYKSLTATDIYTSEQYFLIYNFITDLICDNEDDPEERLTIEIYHWERENE